jgi:hypothetical protein
LELSREVLQIASDIFLFPVSFLPFSALFGSSQIVCPWRRTYDPQLAGMVLDEARHYASAICRVPFHKIRTAAA